MPCTMGFESTAKVLVEHAEVAEDLSVPWSLHQCTKQPLSMDKALENVLGVCQPISQPRKICALRWHWPAPAFMSMSALVAPLS